LIVDYFIQLDWLVNDKYCLWWK